jgi:hypothetical protein
MVVVDITIASHPKYIKLFIIETKMYLKITNKNENHNGLQYHTGLVADIIPFKKEGSCVAGGIYYTTPEFICNFLNYGPWLREVTIPEDAEFVQDPSGDKWRSNKVILGERKDLSKVETWKYLVEECHADIHFENEYALRYASYNGLLEVVKYLVEECHADIHANAEFVVRNGRLEVIQYLVAECGADIHVSHVSNEEAVRWASRNGHIESIVNL